MASSADKELSMPETEAGTAWGCEGHPFYTDEVFSVTDFKDIDDFYEESDNDANLLSAVKDALQRKYNKFTSIILDIDQWPSRFCYHNESEEFKPNYEEYDHVIYSTFQVLYKNCISVWQKLDQDAQDKLYSILCTGRSLFRRLIFNDTQSTWVLRSCPPKPNEPMSHIVYYGMKLQTVDPSAKSGVMQYLARGRSSNEIKASLKNIEKSLGYHKIEDVWQLALTAGMTNGLGRVAVFSLLDNIAGLIRGLDTHEIFNDVVPKIAILNVTSSTACDGFSIVSSPLPAQTRSSGSTRSSPISSPPIKRKKMGKSSPADGSGDACSGRKKSKNDVAVVTWPRHNRQYVDMSVVCMDGTSGVAKYLFLVEIHSRGKSVDEAKRKFTAEIIHTLQAQNVVFGLFFRMIEVELITGKKQVNGRISISQQRYKLGPDGFSVKNFQVLIMDIFSCMIYGIKHIDA